MKRGLLGVAALLVFAIATWALPLTGHAQAWEWETVTFEGVVTRPDGSPVPNLMVMVDCLNSPTGFTNAQGHYVIKGSSHLCLDDPIAVFTYIRYSPDLASDDVATLLDVTVHTSSNPHKINRADITMGLRTVDVPEYDWFGGLAAVGGGLAVITHTRYSYRRSTVEK